MDHVLVHVLCCPWKSLLGSLFHVPLRDIWPLPLLLVQRFWHNCEMSGMLSPCGRYVEGEMMWSRSAWLRSDQVLLFVKMGPQRRI